MSSEKRVSSRRSPRASVSPEGGSAALEAAASPTASAMATTPVSPASSLTGAKNEPLWGIYISDDVFKVNQSGSELFYTLVQNNTIERLYREYLELRQGEGGSVGGAGATDDGQTGGGASKRFIDGTVVRHQLAAFLYNYPMGSPYDRQPGSHTRSSSVSAAKSCSELLYTFDYCFYTVNKKFTRQSTGAHGLASGTSNSSFATSYSGSGGNTSSSGFSGDDLYSLMTVPSANVFEKVNTSACTPVATPHTTTSSSSANLNFFTNTYALMSQLRRDRVGTTPTTAAAGGGGARTLDIEGAIEAKIREALGPKAAVEHVDEFNRRALYYRRVATAIEHLLLERRKVNHYYSKNINNNNNNNSGGGGGGSANISCDNPANGFVHPLHYYTNTLVFNNISSPALPTATVTNSNGSSPSCTAVPPSDDSAPRKTHQYEGNTVYDFRISDTSDNKNESRVFQNSTSFVKGLGVCLKTMAVGDENYFIIRHGNTHRYSLPVPSLVLQTTSLEPAVTTTTYNSGGDIPFNNCIDGNTTASKMFFHRECPNGTSTERARVRELNELNVYNTRNAHSSYQIMKEGSDFPLILRITLRDVRRYFPLYVNPSLDRMCPALDRITDADLSSSSDGGIEVTASFTGSSSSIGLNKAHYFGSSKCNPFVFLRNTLAFTRLGKSGSDRLAGFLSSPLPHSKKAAEGSAALRDFLHTVFSRNAAAADSLREHLLFYFIFQFRVLGVEYSDAGMRVGEKEETEEEAEKKDNAAGRVEEFINTFLLQRTGLFSQCGYYLYQQMPVLMNYRNKVPNSSSSSSGSGGNTAFAGGGGGGVGGSHSAGALVRRPTGSNNLARENLAENYAICYKNKTVTSHSIGGVQQSVLIDFLLSSLPYRFTGEDDGRDGSATTATSASGATNSASGGKGREAHRKVCCFVHLNELEVNYLFCSMYASQGYGSSSSALSFAEFNRNSLEEERFVFRFLHHCASDARCVVRADGGGAATAAAEAKNDDGKKAPPEGREFSKLLAYHLSCYHKLPLILTPLNDNGGTAACSRNLFLFEHQDPIRISPEERARQCPAPRKDSSNVSRAPNSSSNISERVTNSNQPLLPFSSKRLLKNSSVYLKTQFMNNNADAGSSRFAYSEVRAAEFYAVDPARCFESVERILKEVSGFLFYYIKVSNCTSTLPSPGAATCGGMRENLGDFNPRFNERVRESFAAIRTEGNSIYNIVSEGLLGSKELAMEHFLRHAPVDGVSSNAQMMNLAGQGGGRDGTSYLAPTPLALAEKSFFEGGSSSSSISGSGKYNHINPDSGHANFHFIFARLLGKCFQKLNLGLLLLFFGVDERSGAATDEEIRRRQYASEFFQYFILVFDRWSAQNNLDTSANRSTHAGRSGSITGSGAGGNPASSSSNSGGGGGGAAAALSFRDTHPFARYMYYVSLLSLTYAQSTGSDKNHRYLGSLAFTHAQMVLEELLGFYHVQLSGPNSGGSGSSSSGGGGSGKRAEGSAASSGAGDANDASSVVKITSDVLAKMQSLTAELQSAVKMSLFFIQSAKQCTGEGDACSERDIVVLSYRESLLKEILAVIG